MNAAIYLRVSTEKQDAQVQEPALVKLCAARGWSGVPVYSETASGAKERPTLDKLCERARRGEYQVIVVWALDRLGRDLWEIIGRVRSLWAAGVRVVSLNDAWIEGADGPVRDLLLMLLAWVATFERQRLRERTRAGLAAAKAKGRVGGRPRAPGIADAVKLWEQFYREDERRLPWPPLAGAPFEFVRKAARGAGVSAATLRRAILARFKKGS